jgi:hypothetical protein
VNFSHTSFIWAEAANLSLKMDVIIWCLLKVMFISSSLSLFEVGSGGYMNHKSPVVDEHPAMVLD